MYTPKVVTDAIAEPISVSYLKLHTRVDGADENDLFSIYIPGARRFFENATGMTLHEKTLEMVYDAWPEPHFILPRATPLIAVEFIKYTDSAGTVTTWGSSNYVIDTDSDLGRVARAYGISWPSFVPYPLNPIRIRYRAGIATTSPATDVSEDIQQCVALLAAHFYHNREAIVLAENGIVVKSQAVEMAARSLISQQIVWRFQ